MRRLVVILCSLSLSGIAAAAPTSAAVTNEPSAATCQGIAVTSWAAPRRVFLGSEGRASVACHQLALAQVLLSRRTDQSKALLKLAEQGLGQSDEVRRLAGRIALREGQWQEAIGLLAPLEASLSDDTAALQELARLAAAERSDALAVRAYERLLQSGHLLPRERFAAKLELAVVLMRGSEQARVDARFLLDEEDAQAYLPDFSPWLAGERLLLRELEVQADATTRAVAYDRPTLSKAHASYFLRNARSERGSRALFGNELVDGNWLKLAPNEMRAIVALSVAGEDAELAARLWTAVAAEPNSLLFRVKAKAQAARGIGGSEGAPRVKAILAPSPS